MKPIIIEDKNPSKRELFSDMYMGDIFIGDNMDDWATSDASTLLIVEELINPSKRDPRPKETYTSRGAISGTIQYSGSYPALNTIPILSTNSTYVGSGTMLSDSVIWKEMRDVTIDDEDFNPSRRTLKRIPVNTPLSWGTMGT